MITWRMAAAWVLALVLATVLAWQIVGLADSQVGATPPQALAPTASTTIASSSSTSPTTSAPTTTTSIPDSTTPTSASSSSSSSSTAAPAAEWSVRTINSPGGVVVVRFRPGEVELQAATPAPGFGVEIDDAGPPRVRVEFENDDDDYRVEARWEGGQLQVDIDD